MTDKQASDDLVQAIIRAIRAVVDPDPERKVIACDDCRTPQLALTSAEEVGNVLGIAHDPTCPAYAAMTEDERYQVLDIGVVVHTVRRVAAE